MPTTYVLRDTNSDLATPINGRFYKQLLTTTGTTGTVTSGAIAGSAIVQGYAFTDVGHPGSAPGTIGGNFSVEMNVTVSSTTCNITCLVSQVSSTGTQKSTTSFAVVQGATLGMHTFNFPSVAAWTWAAGDRLRVIYEYRRTSSMGNETVTITANTINAEVVTPWTIVPTVSGTALGAVTAVGTASGTKEVFGTATGAVAAIGAAAGEVVTPGINTTLLTASSSATAGTSFTTASVDPADDAVVWLAVSVRHATAEPATPTVSGCGLTWTQVGTGVYFDTTTTRTKLFVFHGHHATPSAGQITISFGASQDGASWNVSQSVNVNNPSAPVVKSASGLNPGGNTPQLNGALDFGSAVAAANAVVSFLSLFDNTAGQVTPEAGYSQVAYAGPEAGESNLSVGTYWDKTGADQTPAWTWTNSALWGAVAVELAPVVEGEVTGTALSAVTAGATASGVVERFGVAASAVAASGVASGVPTKMATALAAVTADATVLGVRTVVGAAVGAVTATATASGTVEGAVSGTALGAVAATGTAIGQKTVFGAALGAVIVAGTAVGQKTITGQALGAVAAVGTASGQVAGTTTGAALGAIAAAATAAGVRTVFGQAVGVVTPLGVAAGTHTVTGVAAGAVAAQGTASGGVVITITGTAVGAVTATGTALGVSGPPITFGVNTRGRSSSPDGRGSTTAGKDARGRTLVGVNAR